MKPASLITCIAFLVCLSCSSEEKSDRKPTLEDFRTHLRADMNYSAMVLTFGTPAKDIGSGIHIYVYVLTDSTEVWIGFVDRVSYARHMDEQGNQLESIL